MDICKKCVYAQRDCSPEMMHIVGGEESCIDFRPKRVKCSRCGKEIIHGERETLICLDCLIYLLDRNGAIELLGKDRSFKRR